MYSFGRRKEVPRDFPPLPVSLNTSRGCSHSRPPPYLQHLGEEGDHADHDKEQAHAVDLPPLDVGVCYGEGLQGKKRKHTARREWSVGVSAGRLLITARRDGREDEHKAALQP